MIYLMVITTSLYIAGRGGSCVPVCFCIINYKSDCVSDVAAMIHHQKQQSIRVPKSICDLSEDVLMSGVQFPGESETRKNTLFSAD